MSRPCLFCQTNTIELCYSSDVGNYFPDFCEQCEVDVSKEAKMRKLDEKGSEFIADAVIEMLNEYNGSDSSDIDIDGKYIHLYTLLEMIYHNAKTKLEHNFEQEQQNQKQSK